MQFTIKSVSVENVVKGRSRYSIAHVTYDDRGQEKNKKIFSFSNPDVFKKVQELVGQPIEVTIGKNNAGYDEWMTIAAAAASGVAPSPATGTAGTGTTRVSGSNYETREERASRQVLIVKQSSLSAAVASLAPGAKGALDPKTVLERAQEYTDWVFSKEESFEDDGSINGMPSDIPF